VSPEAIWYGRSLSGRVLSLLLAPAAWLYCSVAVLRAAAYRHRWLGSGSAGVPVIVVGNLTVGGTGKTPLVLWLVGHLRRRGLRPGIATRGYGGEAADGPRLVPAHADPLRYGDEPVLLAANGGCPVVAARDRLAAARLLASAHGCDCVVTDDGLQHYRLRRDCEILVVDGMRGHGNGRCLPAGPLREPRGRGARADLTIVNGPGSAPLPGSLGMSLVPGNAVNLYHPGVERPLESFRGETVAAIAGIGNPERFFSMLRGLGLSVQANAFPDHHRFTEADIATLSAHTVLMTEKDAIKCRRWARATHWLVPVRAEPEAVFAGILDGMLDDWRGRHRAAERGARPDTGRDGHPGSVA
jgi:tetraacyldisaccharide 4'-kinase